MTLQGLGVEHQAPVQHLVGAGPGGIGVDRPAILAHHVVVQGVAIETRWNLQRADVVVGARLVHVVVSRVEGRHHAGGCLHLVRSDQFLQVSCQCSPPCLLVPTPGSPQSISRRCVPCRSDRSQSWSGNVTNEKPTVLSFTSRTTGSTLQCRHRTLRISAPGRGSPGHSGSISAFVQRPRRPRRPSCRRCTLATR